MLDTLRTWLLSLLRLFFPRCCVVCGEPLPENGEVLCLKCNMNLPRTNYHLMEDNPVEKMFWGKIPLGRATAYFFYRKGGEYRHILHELKYNGRQDVGEAMGRFMAEELKEADFFREMEVIVPVPLHPRKQRSRGYNQSERIARGIAAVTGLPVDTGAVVRLKDTETQTRKAAYERWENVAGIFRLTDPKRFIGRHVLLVDDVLTTGATTTACADAFAEVEDVRISVLTLAVAVSL